MMIGRHKKAEANVIASAYCKTDNNYFSAISFKYLIISSPIFTP
jgi:hypothetical protein